MYYELALVSVLIAAGYWGSYFVRHSGTRMYGAIQLAAAAMAGLGLVARKSEEPGVLGVIGAIGVGAGACLIVVGPLVRGLARRLVALERFTAANALLEVADVLTPGAGVGEEKALVGAMREIRDGNIDPSVDALMVAKRRAPEETRLAIDERIAMLYLAAHRWEDAIAHAEATLALLSTTGNPDDSDQAPHSLVGNTVDSGLELRHALGIAPPLWVELLGAYGYKGDLDQAARMLERLEDVCARRGDAAVWIHRARVMFLALAGRIAGVEALVHPSRSRHMSRAARAYWKAVAHERRGDAPAATAEYIKARAGSRGRPRALIDRALDRMPNIRSIELPPAASELVARVEASPPPKVVPRIAPRGPWATRGLLASLVAVAAVVAVALGESSDIGVLIRAGAMARGLVYDGQWWRMVSGIFLHVGGLHLVANLIGLWFLGRLCEGLFGSMRTIAIFGAAGLGGAAASLAASPVGISAGASGAVFGLLGAAMMELTWHRKRHRVAWTRGLWGSLAIVALGQLGIDLMTDVTDPWAHGGGFATGLAMGLALSPHVAWAKGSLWVARAVAGCFAVACAAAAYCAATTTLEDSFGGPTRIAVLESSLSLRAPTRWVVSGNSVRDPDGVIDVFAAPSSAAVGPTLLAGIEAERKRARDLEGFEQVALSAERVVALPPGWVGAELTISSADLGGEHHRYRVVCAVTGVAEGSVFVSAYVPDLIARTVPHLVTRMLASVTVEVR